MPHVATRERLLRTFVVAEERRWRTTCGAATIRASPFWPSTTLLPMPLAMEVGGGKGFSMLILWEIGAQFTIYMCDQSPTRGIVDRAIQPVALPDPGNLPSSTSVLTELFKAIEACHADPDVEAIVVTGTKGR